ncbi:MAG: tetratricopeptide repeat protein [Deltaproteobacteria bacterium]|nr:tetratricopeptide repeat protein [Deltaproteobacteria bacterium]
MPAIPHKIIKPAVFLFAVIALSSAAILRNAIWENRLTLWKNVVERSPEKARGRYNLGNAFTAFNMFDHAMREYQIAVNIDQSFFHGNVHGALGIVYVRKGLLDKALNEFQTALQMNPHSARPHYGLGIIYENKGSLDEAIREYKLAAAIEPNYAEPYAALGIAYGKKDMFIEARDALENAVNLKPEIPYSHYNLAVTVDRLGDYKYAILHYKEFLRLASSNDKSPAIQFSKKRIAELEGYMQQQ